MHIFSIGSCIVALVASALLIAVAIPLNLFSLLLIGSQIIVYVVIAFFAWLSRKHTIASGVVALMTAVAIGLEAVMLHFLFALVSSPAAGPVVLFLIIPIFGQMLVGFLGCYFGYAAIEYRAASANQSNLIRGKLFVLSIVLVALGFVATLWAFSQ